MERPIWNGRSGSGAWRWSLFDESELDALEELVLLLEESVLPEL